MLLQVKRLFKELKVDFLAVELDEVGKLLGHVCINFIMCCTSLLPQDGGHYVELLCMTLWACPSAMVGLWQASTERI